MNIKETFGLMQSKIFKAPPELAFLYKPKVIPPMDLPNFTEVGWELEAEGWQAQNVPPGLLEEPRAYIDNKEDGSLKDGGVEFITKGPLNNQGVYNSLLEVKRIEEKLKKGLKFSHRCSFHVHLNFQNNTLADVTNFFAAFMAVEPILFTLCEEHRKGNSYCVPLNFLNLTKKYIKEGNYNQTKYWALSINRLQDLGTLEVRMHHGTTDIAKLQEWIKLLQHIYAFACIGDIPNTMMKKKLLSISSQEQKTKLIQEILGTDKYNHLVSEHSLETDDSLFNAIFFLEN